MFPVPGWAVPAAAPRTQTHTRKDSAPMLAAGAPPNAMPTVQMKRKRKRTNSLVTSPDVHSPEFSDLWERVIEKRWHTQQLKDKNSKQKDVVSQSSSSLLPTNRPSIRGKFGDLNGNRSQKVYSNPKRAKLSTTPEQGDCLEDQISDLKSETPQDHKKVIVPPLGTPSHLTPLQSSMRQKLVSARFRYLNQTLYTTDSHKASFLFVDNPEMFNEYHVGFRQQVEAWPENPVSGYVTQIKNRGLVVGQPSRRRGSNKDGELKIGGIQNGDDLVPLPRSSGVCHIADLGCGDAAISRTLGKQKKKLGLKVSSFDLVSKDRLITQADIANLPLQDNSVDIAIFCLSLMGTNWTDFIEEAYRVLKWKGELWVTEIKSRFGRGDANGRRAEHSVGNKKKSDSRISKGGISDLDHAENLIEAAGHDDLKGETDISAFLSVLGRRGFVLNGNAAQSVDSRNKMFIRMSFTKSATIVKRLDTQTTERGAEAVKGGWSKRMGPGSLKDVHTLDEASVLKPCLYKVR